MVGVVGMVGVEDVEGCGSLTLCFSYRNTKLNINAHKQVIQIWLPKLEVVKPLHGRVLETGFLLPLPLNPKNACPSTSSSTLS